MLRGAEFGSERTMTDIESYTAMLDRAGVTYSKLEYGDYIEVKCEAGEGPNNDGYFGFCLMHYFAPVSGALMRVGAWV